MQTGVAWQGASNVLTDLRHACHHHHKLQNWGWKAHDGSSYGFEHIGDKVNNVVSVVHGDSEGNINTLTSSSDGRSNGFPSPPRLCGSTH